MSVELLPTRHGQPLTMTVATDDPDGGHWCEHGPCAAIIHDVSNPYADHHGPDWTQRDSEYLK